MCILTIHDTRYFESVIMWYLIGAYQDIIAANVTRDYLHKFGHSSFNHVWLTSFSPKLDMSQQAAPLTAQHNRNVFFQSILGLHVCQNRCLITLVIVVFKESAVQIKRNKVCSYDSNLVQLTQINACISTPPPLFSLLSRMREQGVQFTSRLWPCNSLSWLKAMGTATAQHIWCVHTTSGWCMYVNFSELLRE